MPHALKHQLKREQTFVQHFMQVGGVASFCTNTSSTRRFCHLPPPGESWTKRHAAQAISRPTKRSHQSCSTRALQPQILFRINLHLRFFDSEHHDKASHFPINHLGTLVTSRQNGQRTVSQPQSQSPALRKRLAWAKCSAPAADAPWSASRVSGTSNRRKHQKLTHRYRKKHQKRLSAPSHWLLDKLSGVYAPRPSAGPHKLRDCMPLIVFVRNRLKYALNYRETKAIMKQRLIKVDGKVRTDMTYPAGFMDVITIDKTGENFRLIYDTKGRFTVHRIQEEEAKYKLGKVKRVQLGRGGIPFLVTHDART